MKRKRIKALFVVAVALVFILMAVASGTGDLFDENDSSEVSAVENESLKEVVKKIELKDYTQYVGKQFQTIESDLSGMGFTSISIYRMGNLITGWLHSPNEICEISINGDKAFKKGDYDSNSEIILFVYSFDNKCPEGHDLEWVESKASTCQESGNGEYYYCSICDLCYEDSKGNGTPLKKDDYSSPILPHDLKHLNYTDATCTQDGNVDCYQCNNCHSFFLDETCQEPLSSADAVIKATQHDYDEGTITTVASCSQSGIKTYTCIKCGQIKTETIAQLSHVYGEGVVTQEASCSQSGVKTYTCTLCGQEKTETIEKLSHEYDMGKITKEATCTQSGTKIFTCSKCGNTKSETIAALGHIPDGNYICKRCGEKCPINIDMTTSEMLSAFKVYYITQRRIYHDDEQKAFRLQFSLLDSNEKELATAAAVTIRIVNDKNETVYSAIKIIRSEDFSTWSNTTTGAKYLLATIYIKDSEIASGKSSKGSIHFSVENSGYFSFEESTLSILDDLPVKGITLYSQSLPITVSYFGFSGTKFSSCKITEIKYEVSGDNLYIYLTLEKTYDKEGSGHSDYCFVNWTLYDDSGYVVGSGSILSDPLKVGEKTKNGKIYVWGGIEPGGTYRLLLSDYN